MLSTLGDAGTRFEFECYDTAHLYNLAHFLERGLVKPPLFVQTVFGILGGIGPHPEDVMHMKRTADRLFGKQYRWSVLGAGRNQLAIAAQAAAMGGNVRVGLEDSLWSGPGKLATSNAEQVRAARQIIEGLGLSVATPGRGARNPRAQGRRPGRVLTARPARIANVAHRASDRRPRRTRRRAAVGRRRAAALLDRQPGREGPLLRRRRRRAANMGRARAHRLVGAARSAAARSSRCATGFTRSILRPAPAASSLTRDPASRASA